MKQFNFNAIDEHGNEHTGFIESSDQTSVLMQLKQRGLYVIDLAEDKTFQVDEKQKEDAWTEILRLAPVFTTQKVFFFKQLALMLRSGMSITEAFDILANMQQGRMRLIASDINRTIKKGEPLSVAMMEHKSIFSMLSIQMIKSAEASGELDDALMRIAHYIEHKAALKKQVLTAMMYPAFTLLVAVGVFIFLLSYIIPKFATFLLNSGKPIPPATQSMIDLGNFFNTNWQLLLLGLIALIVTFIYTYKTPKGKKAIDHIFLSIPVVGATLVSAAMAQISWAMSMLLKSGIPVVDTLRIISEMIGNSVIAESVSTAADKVLHGQDLATSFAQPYITPLVHQLMTVGERSGNLVQIMEEASVYYEDDLQTKTKTLANMVEPMSILLIGASVGYVYYGFFQALLAVSTGR